jgi:hypothetical protein
MLTGELLTLFRCVLFAREPVTAADICGRTGYAPHNIEDELQAMRMSGDVEIAESTPAGQRWRTTERWADAVPWRGTSRQHTLREFVKES